MKKISGKLMLAVLLFSLFAAMLSAMIVPVINSSRAEFSKLQVVAEVNKIPVKGEVAVQPVSAAHSEIMAVQTVRYKPGSKATFYNNRPAGQNAVSFLYYVVVLIAIGFSTALISGTTRTYQKGIGGYLHIAGYT